MSKHLMPMNLMSKHLRPGPPQQAGVGRARPRPDHPSSRLAVARWRSRWR